uniref:ABC transmembrane type-1 domain-containing protein n=1 Tax=Anopheles maculatus TaxID=74869 RepID=A0A182T719_9DIPT
MAPNLSKVLGNQNAVVGIAGCTAAVCIILYGKQIHKNRKQRPEDEIQYLISDKKEKRSPKAHVNAVFFNQLRALLALANRWALQLKFIIFSHLSRLTRRAVPGALTSSTGFGLTGIIIPKAWSVENGLLIVIALSLIARSVSDIWMIQNATAIESTIITMNKKQFRTALVKYLSALPA